MKKVKKYAIATIFVTIIFAFIAGYYKIKPQFFQQQTPPSQAPGQTIHQTKLLLQLQKQLEESTKIIENLSIKTLPTVLPKPENEHYARLTLTLLNIQTQLQKSEKFNIKINIKTIQNLSKTDPVLQSIFIKAKEVNEVFGVEYFKKNFGKLTRQVASNSSILGGFFQKTVQKWLSPHFSYIALNSSKSGQILYNAKQYLKSEEFSHLHEELSKIEKKTPFLTEYQENLQNFIIVSSATNSALEYIEETVFTQI